MRLPPPTHPQVILNGHEYVACRAQAAGIGFAKEVNCFAEIADPQRLAQIAETLRLELLPAGPSTAPTAAGCR